MSPTGLLLADRRDEFEQHWSVVSFLEARSGESLGVAGGGNLERRHVAISKAGLLAHLYNIVEAVMSFQLEEVMKAIAWHQPSTYEECVLQEWVKQQAGTHIQMGDEARLAKSLGLANVLTGKEPVSVVAAPAASGNWDDERIEKIAKRLGCKISVSAPVRKAARSPYFNGKSRMFYIKKRRNDLAHGSMTFEDGGREKTLPEIKDLADPTLDFLGEVVASFDLYLAKSDFLAKAKP